MDRHFDPRKQEYVEEFDKMGGKETSAQEGMDTEGKKDKKG